MSDALSGTTLAPWAAAPGHSFEIQKADFLRYAGASGDFFPLHTDDEYARAAGQPGVFAHGMYSAGLLATALTDWLGVATLRRFQVRFAAKAWPGERLTTRIECTGHRKEDGLDVVDFSCVLEGEDGQARVMGSGTATPGAPPRGDAPFQSLLSGTPCGTQVVAIDRAAVSNFAVVLREESACYFDVRAAHVLGFTDVPAPPTYPFVMTHWGVRDELNDDFGGEPVAAKRGTEFMRQLGHIGNALVDLIDELGPGMVLHAEQDFTYHRAPVVGDILRGENAITSVERGATKSYACIETRWADARTGSAVVTAKFTVVHLARPAHQKEDQES